MTRLFAALIVAVFAALPARAIEVQELTSPAGQAFWLVEEHSIPFVAMQLTFAGGAALDLPGKRGATNLMAGLLEEGAGDMDAAGFQAALEALAGSVSFDTGNDGFGIAIQALSENREEVLDLAALAMTAPRFDEDAVERVRAQVISIIQRAEKDPEDIASARFNALAFDAHPYATDKDGTVESVSALTREDLLAAHRNALTRSELAIGIVGDVDAAAAGLAVDRLVSGLPDTGPEGPGKVAFGAGGGTSVIDFPSPQSVAIFGSAGIDRDDPEFFPAFVMMHILGGQGFDSRLHLEVREKRGLTYGVGAWISSLDRTDMLMGSVASANDRIAEAIAVIRTEWQRMADEGVTDAELRAAQDYLTGAYPLRFDGNARIASILVGMQLQGLPVAYIAERNDKVRAVTQADIARVAQRLLGADALRFVVVGQPVGLDATD